MHVCKHCYLCLLTQKADEEAAAVYEEFVASFQGDEAGRDGGVKAFVRGGVVAPGSRSTDASGAYCKGGTHKKLSQHSTYELCWGCQP